MQAVRQSFVVWLLAFCFIASMGLASGCVSKGFVEESETARDKSLVTLGEARATLFVVIGDLEWQRDNSKITATQYANKWATANVLSRDLDDIRTLIDAGKNSEAKTKLGKVQTTLKAVRLFLDKHK